MARPKKKSCDDTSCLHVMRPRVDPDRRAMDALCPDDDDDALNLVERRIVSVVNRSLDASHAVLTDCLIERCDLANAVFRRARLNRVAFVDCRLVGADFGDESWLEDVTFAGCTLDLSTFDRASLRRVVFSHTRLEGAAFGGASLERIAFPDCALARCDFTGASAPGGAGSIDLRGASLAAASFDTRLLRALTISPEDGATIAAALGITVKVGCAQTTCKD